MIDRTVHQAVKGRAKTVPVDRAKRGHQRKGKEPIPQDELATAIELARLDRIKQDIRDYADRKRS